MPVIRALDCALHELPHARIRSLVTPSRGSRETSLWRVEFLGAGKESPRHSLTREEIFLVLSGRLRFELQGEISEASAGDAFVVPAHTEFRIVCVSPQAEALCCLPVGGQGRIENGELFTPPWAL